jgi:hypothetical protein
METGFAVTALISIILNLLIPEEDAEAEAESLAGDVADNELEMKLERAESHIPTKGDVEDAHSAPEPKTLEEV